MHTCQVGESTNSHGLAVVSWPLHHLLQHTLGKPYEIWCKELYECSLDNFVVPLENISCLLLTAMYTFEESVLIVVPLLD